MSERWLRVSGRVQGVGYRAFAARAGRNLGLSGAVRNEADGAVVVRVSGEAAAVESFRAALARGPVAARVEAVRELTEGDRPTGRFDLEF